MKMNIEDIAELLCMVLLVIAISIFGLRACQGPAPVDPEVINTFYRKCESGDVYGFDRFEIEQCKARLMSKDK